MAEYTPIGQGTYNTVAGSVGLASALFGGNGGNLFGGLFAFNSSGVIDLISSIAFFWSPVSPSEMAGFSFCSSQSRSKILYKSHIVLTPELVKMTNLLDVVIFALTIT